MKNKTKQQVAKNSKSKANHAERSQLPAVQKIHNLNYNIEYVDKWHIRLIIDIFTQELRRIIDQRILNVYAGGVKVDGFRAGKAPIDMLRSAYGNKVFDEIVTKILNQAMVHYNIISDRLLSAPKLAYNTLDDKEKFVFEITLFPQLSFVENNSVQIPYITASAKQDDVWIFLENRYNKEPNYNQIFTDVANARFSQMGDKLVIDFEGRIDDKLIDGASGQNVECVIGAGKFLAQFENSLIGLQINEETTFDVEFPDDYHGGSVAGRSVSFSIKVKEIWAKKYFEFEAELEKFYHDASYEYEHSMPAIDNTEQTEHAIEKKSTDEMILFAKDKIIASWQILLDIKYNFPIAMSYLASNCDLLDMPDSILEEIMHDESDETKNAIRDKRDQAMINEKRMSYIFRYMHNQVNAWQVDGYDKTPLAHEIYSIAFAHTFRKDFAKSIASMNSIFLSYMNQMNANNPDNEYIRMIRYFNDAAHKYKMLQKIIHNILKNCRQYEVNINVNIENAETILGNISGDITHNVKQFLQFWFRGLPNIEHKSNHEEEIVE